MFPALMRATTHRALTKKTNRRRMKTVRPRPQEEPAVRQSRNPRLRRPDMKNARATYASPGSQNAIGRRKQTGMNARNNGPLVFSTNADVSCRDGRGNDPGRHRYVWFHRQKASKFSCGAATPKSRLGCIRPKLSDPLVAAAGQRGNVRAAGGTAGETFAQTEQSVSVRHT